MGYEQLSTVIVLVIVLIGIVAWLPVRTAKSMRHVEEHREDRFSSSLHLVDEHSGTRFSDEGTYAKGVLMQPNERRTNKLTPERIAEVRRLRRRAVRRRQILVVSLLLVAIVVAAIAFPLHFNPWFALIPVALDIVVLVLGARAAGQAREWERKVAKARARERRSRMAKTRAQARTVDAQTAAVKAEVEGMARSAKAMAAALAEEPADAAAPAKGEEVPTAEMERREIRRVLRQAEIEQRQALAAHGKLDAPDVHVVDVAAAQAAAQPQTAAASAAPSGSEAVQVVSRAEGPQADAPSAAAKPADDASARSAAVIPADATTELAEVRPAKALDAFDMAIAAQDLISFSLGEPRNVHQDQPDAPESREIKSTKQVAKADPVDADEERRLAGEARMETKPAGTPAEPEPASAGPDPSSGAAATDDASGMSGTSDMSGNDGSVIAAMPQNAGVSDVAAFHESEEQARVAVPAATSDSLGNNLQAILDRRSS
ncbi:hypothetical protein [Bifidobacterium parmae]|uniref:Uncharacterized protein n=1 Tax=Bifidobacterium parmae TaxID=361854 RepID=A0A2N5IW42_9BIFI|nr:hypothetical protein [Bifidobacterium parmae]PLS26161.1 hypothetical protein Uis4E_2114 [Bifidobacterium parmae]